MSSTAPALLGIDWGTSRRRAYALHASGRLLRSATDDEGALACRGRFPAALRSLIEALAFEPDVVVMSGMVGSAFGWELAPYADGTLPLPGLSRQLHRVRGEARPTCIVPGYLVRGADGAPDVMRGEETQLLGAWAIGRGEGWIVLPGTHAKWVRVKDGRVLALHTFMTGELFELLGREGTLAAAAAGAPAQAWNEESFLRGVRAAGGPLSMLLFGARARVLAGDLPAAAVQAYLSGLLIGTEFAGMRARLELDAAPLRLLGSPSLAGHYARAAAALGLATETVDADQAYLAALRAIQNAWTGP